MRLIDADELKKAIAQNRGIDSDTVCDVLDIIDNAQTVEPTFKPIATVNFDKKQLQEIIDKAKAEVLASVERPQGEWIYDSDHSITIDMYRCSVCGCYGHTHFKFCSNCGAKMEVVRNER